MTIDLNKKIVKENGIWFTHKGDLTINNNKVRVNYYYVISRNYYETDEKFKNGINELLNLCGLSHSYSYMNYDNQILNYDKVYTYPPYHRYYDHHVFDFI